MIVRALDPTHPTDAALGQALVVEYVEATFAESESYGEAVPRTLTRSLFPEAYDFAAVYCEAGFAYLVAESDDRIAGGVGLKPLRDANHPDVATCEMKRMWVRPEFRRRGTARELAVGLLDHARACRYERMVLDVTPQRVGAIALYRSLGFADCAPTHDYPFSMVFLARSLTSP